MYYISWNEFESLSLELGKKIIDSKKKYSAVICVSRGGLLLGRLLSGVLNLPLGVISAKFVNNKYVVDNNISCLFDIKGDILLVDDVLEQKESEEIVQKIKKIQKEVKKIDLASIFYRSENEFVPTYYVNKIKDRLTIVFPYQEEIINKDLDD